MLRCFVGLTLTIILYLKEINGQVRAWENQNKVLTTFYWSKYVQEFVEDDTGSALSTINLYPLGLNMIDQESLLLHPKNHKRGIGKVKESPEAF